MFKSKLNLLMDLWHHIDCHHRKQLGFLLVLMLLASFIEILSIGAVFPFLGVLTSPEKIFLDPRLHSIFLNLGLVESQQLLLPLTISFCCLALVSGALRLLLLWANTRLSYSIGANLGVSIYQRTIYQPYEMHCNRNSSEIIDGVSNKTDRVINIITMLLTLISSASLLVAIMASLMVINLLVALAAFGGFGFLYLFLIYATKKRLMSNSSLVAIKSAEVIRVLQEGLGGIRDIIIDGTQAAYCKIYSNSDLPLRRAQGSSSFIAASPRYGMESIGMVLIALIAYSLASQDGDIDAAIPVVGVLAFAAQRLLPVLQQAYAAWSGIQANQASLEGVLGLLSQPISDVNHQSDTIPIAFKNTINLKHLSFYYGNSGSYILNQINLEIRKGARIGFIGLTGSGKSTLLDIIMGLLQPSSGRLEVDGCEITISNQRAWQLRIAHVPQSIFLADTTIEENIAFGIPKSKIDRCRVKEVAKKAQISSIIESWTGQYQTVVGENGMRLSGGQRQRIGIARALYKKADVIIFDEATSALDVDTEQAVMNAIDNLDENLTLLIIAHRITTLKNCNQIVELGEGVIKRVDSYQATLEAHQKGNK